MELPEIKPAAADRDHQRIEIGHFVEQFQSSGALAGDGPGMIVGRNKRSAGFVARFRCAMASRSSVARS